MDDTGFEQPEWLGFMTSFGGSPPPAPKPLVDTSGAGITPYSIGSVDLSWEWLQLVRGGKVSVVTPVQKGAKVRFGVRFVPGPTNGNEKEGDLMGRCETFAEVLGDESREMNSFVRESLSNSLEEKGSATVQFERHDPYAVELQLVRKLRPPPSPGFSTKPSSTPPPYNKETDSFVTGPLRLQLRDPVWTIRLYGMSTGWDVFHDVAPTDTRGHFLILPTLADKRNWRGQQLTKSDVSDLILLSSTISPEGSLLVSYNSPGAGASQNHMHCHVWPTPPVSLIQEENGWEVYAASKAPSAGSVGLGKGVLVRLLDYPVFCIKLSSTSGNRSLKIMAKALSMILDVAGDVPHNVCFLNRPPSDKSKEGGPGEVDAYVFLRSAEQSSKTSVMPWKLGASEMMGVFQARTERDMKELAGEEAMMHSLKDVSLKGKELLDVWEKVKSRLGSL